MRRASPLAVVAFLLAFVAAAYCLSVAVVEAEKSARARFSFTEGQD